LLTTMGDHGASTREVYSPIEFSLGLDNVAIESYIPAIRKIHVAHARGPVAGERACCEKRFETSSAQARVPGSDVTSRPHHACR
jgi:hypothetical protein